MLDPAEQKGRKFIFEYTMGASFMPLLIIFYLTMTLYPDVDLGGKNIHSSKILTIQQGLPRGVNSVGNPWGSLTGFNSGSVAEESSDDQVHLA